jgi:hypothetical protein
MWRIRLFDTLVQAATWAAGGLLLLTIVAVFYYLFAESQYAFQRKFPFGFRVALQPPDSEYREEISMDRLPACWRPIGKVPMSWTTLRTLHAYPRTTS